MHRAPSVPLQSFISSDKLIYLGQSPQLWLEESCGSRESEEHREEVFLMGTVTTQRNILVHLQHV